MRRRSPRHADEDEAYRQLRAQLLGQPCQVCPPLLEAARQMLERGAITRPLELTCGGRSTECHHRRKRSSAGALAEPANVVASCHDGNMAVEAHPLVALEAGLVVREGHPEWDALSARTWRLAQL